MKGAGLGGCVATKNLLQKKGTLKWCYKDVPVNDLDNGWRFLSDIDTQEYLNDPSHSVVCDWNTIVEIEPAVLPLFYLPIGTDLVFVEENGRKFFISAKTGKELKLY